MGDGEEEEEEEGSGRGEDEEGFDCSGSSISDITAMVSRERLKARREKSRQEILERVRALCCIFFFFFQPTIAFYNDEKFVSLKPSTILIRQILKFLIRVEQYILVEFTF